MPNSENLLHRYTLTGDPACFRSLVEEFGGMVYAVCLRITRDQHAAEDLSQDCFLELARNAATLRTSVAGWLHSAATNRALNLIRSRKRDRKYERLGEPTTPIRETEDFSELQPFVDEALDRLDQQLREIVISHYLRGETQSEIAGHLGIDQSTVSRRLAQGLDDVRSHLRRMGILTTVAALMNVLGQNTASAAPANLTEMVAKVGLAGVGWTATTSAAGSFGLLATAAVAAIGNVMLYLVCDGWIFLLLLAVEFALLSYPPGWFRELVAAWSLGHDPWSHPAFPLKRWTWTVPPPDWKQRLAAWTFLGLVWGLAATAVLAKDRDHWGGPAAFALLAAFGVLQAARLGMRVWRFRHNLPIAAADALTVPGTFTSWESVAVAAAALLVGVTLLVAAPRNRDAGIPVIHAVLLWSNIFGSAAIVLWGLRSRLTSAREAQRLTPQEGPVEASAPAPVKKVGFAVLAILLLAALVNVLVSLFSAATSPFVLREPYLRQVPFGIAAGGGIGMILAVVFLFRLRLMRAQVVRWGYLMLLATGISLLGCGAGLTGYGGYLAQTMPPPAPPAASLLKRPLSPAELAFQEKSQQLRKKYAREMAAVVPSPMPGTFVSDMETFSMFPMVQEGTDLHAVELAEELELPAAAQLQQVQALLIHCFVGTLDAQPLNLVTYTFVCESRAVAEGLAQAWGPRAIQKEYLVIIPFGPETKVPLTANDQLNSAIRRQVDSSDLSHGPPE